MLRFFVSLVLLTVVYAMVVASFAPADLALGALFSAVVLYVFGGQLSVGVPVRGLFGKILHLPLFVAASAIDVAKGTYAVVLVALHLKRLESPGIVAVPIGERTDLGLTVSALETTLSPGTYLVDVDRERGVWYVHALDASDPEAVRRDREDFYRKYQRKVFP